MFTVKESVDVFLSRHLRPLSLKQYSYVLHPLAAFLGNDRDIDLVSEADLMRYQKHLLVRLKPITVANYISVIKAWSGWLTEGEYIHRNPARRLERKRPPRSPDEDRAIPPVSLRKMVDYARLTHPRNYAALMMMLASGVRVGGLLSMTWERINFERQFAYVEDKGGGYYKAYFGPVTTAALTGWLERHPRKEGAVWTGKGPDYKAIKSGAVYAFFKDLCYRAGVGEDYHPHCIRHSRGHALGKAGIPLTIIARILNHADPAITAEFYQPHDDAYVALIAQRTELLALADSPEAAFRPSNILAAAV